jgi:hypothetical protein
MAELVVLPGTMAKIDTKKLRSVPTAAARLKMTRSGVYDAIAAGRLDSIEIDGISFVTESSLERYLKTRRPRGPKPKHLT